MRHVGTAVLGRDHLAIDLRWLVGLPVALVTVGALSAASPVWAVALVLAVCVGTWLAVSGPAAPATALVALVPWLIVFLEPVPDELRTLVAALAAGLAFLATGSRSRPTAWLVGATLLLVPAFISLAATSSSGAFQFLRYLAFIALVGFVASDGGPRVAERMLRFALPSACGALVVHAAIVALGRGSTGTYYGHGERLGFTSSPHDLAFFAAAVGITALLRLERAELRYGLFAVACTVTLLTGVRSAMIGLILFAVLLLFRRGARSQQLALLAAAAGAVFATGADDVLRERFLSSEQSGEFAQVASAGSGRGEIWSNALSHWQDAGPIGWLLGTGLRTIPGFSDAAFGSPLSGHSDVVEIVVQLGVVGLTGYCALVFVLFRAAATRLVLTIFVAAALLNGAVEYIAPLTLIVVFAAGRKEGRPRSGDDPRRAIAEERETRQPAGVTAPGSPGFRAAGWEGRTPPAFGDGWR